MVEPNPTNKFARLRDDPKSLFGGPEFNLSLELGRAGNDQQALAAISQLWSYPNIDGPWADADTIGASGRKGAITELRDTELWRFGTLRLEEATPPLPLVVYLIREQRASAEQRSAKIQFGVQTQEPSDWLTIGIPVYALQSRWPVNGSCLVHRDTAMALNTLSRFFRNGRSYPPPRSPGLWRHWRGSGRMLAPSEPNPCSRSASGLSAARLADHRRDPRARGLRCSSGSLDPVCAQRCTCSSSFWSALRTTNAERCSHRGVDVGLSKSGFDGLLSAKSPGPG